MKTGQIIMATGTLLAGGLLLAGPDRVETRTLERAVTVRDGGTGTLLVVDNVFGSIRVRGESGDTIRMTAAETVEVRSDAAFRRAREEVELQVTEERDEIELSVPRGLDLQLATVTGGTIRVEDVDCSFETLNGDILIRAHADLRRGRRS